MIEVLAETRTVWRAMNKKRRTTRLARSSAYRDAAIAAYLVKHPCTCFRDIGDGGWPERHLCEVHEMLQERRGSGDILDRTITRLARWLLWRDRRRAELGLAVCAKHGDCNEPKGVRVGVSFECAVETALLQPERDLRSLRSVLVDLVGKIDARIGAVR